MKKPANDDAKNNETVNDLKNEVVAAETQQENVARGMETSGVNGVRKTVMENDAIHGTEIVVAGLPAVARSWHYSTPIMMACFLQKKSIRPFVYFGEQTVIVTAN